MPTVAFRRFAFCLLVCFFCLNTSLSRWAQAGPFTPLHSFGSTETSQSALIQGQNGAFYGTVENGGTNGAGGIFTINADGSGYHSLHAFGGKDSQGHPDGAHSAAALLFASDGMLYGTTLAGGTNGTGTIFKIKPDGTGETVIHAFSAADGDGINADGISPAAAVIQNNGILYGTTWHGGSGGMGVVFQVNPDGTGFAVLHSFSKIGTYPLNLDGAEPTSPVLYAAGNLLGTTSAGGPIGSGVIYKISLADKSYQVLHSFDLSPVLLPEHSGSPHSGLTSLDGRTFFGTTPWGGEQHSPDKNGSGVVFSIDLGGNYTILHKFQITDSSGVNSDGARPYAPLTLDGTTLYGTTLYGTTSEGGPGSSGTIFKISTDGSGFGTLYSFAGKSVLSGGSAATGAAPNTGLTLATDHFLYGTTSQGGVNGTGTIYKLTAGLLHVLWNATSGGMSLWTLTATGDFTHHEYGPFAGWTARAVADGSDGKTRILWGHTDGRMSMWSLDDSNGAYTHAEFGPFAGWTANALSVGTDGTTHVLWTNTGGTASVWNYSTAAGTYTHQEYGPYPGWSAKAVADGADGKMRVLWDNTDGRMSLWSLDNVAGIFSQFTFGPFPGWTANAVSVGTDNTTHILWNCTDGRASLWSGSTATGIYAHYEYGAYPGWTAKAIADGAGVKTQVLWNKTDGTVSLWNLDTAATGFAQFLYGPYSGWTASSVSVGASLNNFSLNNFSRQGQAEQPNSRRTAAAGVKNPSAPTSHLRPHRIRVRGGSSFGDWGEFGYNGGAHMSQPDSIAVVSLTLPTSPTTYLNTLCVTDSVDTLGFYSPVRKFAFFDYNSSISGYESYGLATSLDQEQSIASDFFGNLYLNVSNGILIERQSISAYSPSYFTPVQVSVIPTGGFVSAVTADNAHQVFFAVGEQVYRANTQTPDPPANLHLEGLGSTVSSLATGPDHSLYAVSGDYSGSHVNKFVNVGDGYLPDVSFSNLSISNPTRIAVDNSTTGSGDIFVTDESDNLVGQYSSAGTLLGYISSNPYPLVFNGSTYDSAFGDILAPLGITVDSTGTVWVVEHGQRPVNGGGFGDTSGGYNNRIVSFAP